MNRMDIGLDTQQLSLFDYASLDSETRVSVQELDTELDLVLKRTSKEVGDILLKAKKILPHGMFQPWHFSKGVSQNMAWRCMQVAQGKEIKSSILDDLPLEEVDHLLGEIGVEYGDALKAMDDIPPIQENLTPEQFVDEIFPGLRQEQPRIVQSLTTLDDIFPGITEYQKQGAPVPESWKLPQEMRGTPVKSAALSALQSSESNEWYTPAQYIGAAREVLGAIDLDPASNAFANETVQANDYFDSFINGLEHTWDGHIWLNPPYGFTDGRSNQEVWSSRLIEQYKAGITKAAVLLVNANTEAKWFQPLYDYTICFTDHRIRFYNANGGSSQPTQGNAFVYFGSQHERFISIFQQFGVIVRRVG